MASEDTDGRQALTIRRHLVRQFALFRFDFFAHTVALNYQSSLLTAGEEAALVLLGPLTVLLIFLLLMLLTLVCILTVHRFPQLCSQFVLAYGVTALLDPFLILVIDLLIGVGVFFRSLDIFGRHYFATQ